MSDGITEAPAARIGELLMDNRFSVPSHQRDYSWTEDEVKKVFDDIESRLRKETRFIPLMVFLNDPKGPLIVLDRLQRSATADSSFLLFGARCCRLQGRRSSRR
jgi:uncharacterized protein with ParB-like and HNH nuclease domain